MSAWVGGWSGRGVVLGAAVWRDRTGWRLVVSLVEAVRSALTLSLSHVFQLKEGYGASAFILNSHVTLAHMGPDQLKRRGSVLNPFAGDFDARTRQDDETLHCVRPCFCAKCTMGQGVLARCVKPTKIRELRQCLWLKRRSERAHFLLVVKIGRCGIGGADMVARIGNTIW